MTTRIPVSVIVLTHDEEVNIAACLESLKPFDEVIVVDSGSADRTLPILRDHWPSVQVLHNEFEDFGQQRNWALEHAAVRNPWVLFFDADERSTDVFAEAVAATVAQPGAHEGFFLCYRNMFLGRWIKHSTMYPSWQLRLLKHGKVRYRKEGHGQREVMAGSAGYIAVPYDHLGFAKGVADWIAKHNEYSTNEVELIRRLAAEPLRPLEVFSRDAVRRRRAQKRLAARVPLRPFVRFVHGYLLGRGFLDGRPGLIFCLLRAAHEMHIVAKLEESIHARSLTSNNPVAKTPPHAAPAAKNPS